ncbi:MAG: hypothetical protein GY880_24645 [Planctomycetaceae bacterium]|nr:hypothetical protein [Planctomycetaceae bacterium]
MKNRTAVRQSLNDNPAFQAFNQEVVDAGKAVKEYEQRALAQSQAE